MSNYLASVATALRSRSNWFAILQAVKHILGGFGSQVLLQNVIRISPLSTLVVFAIALYTYIVVIVDGKDRSVDACTCALNFDQCEFAILGGLTNLDLQVILDGFQNLGGSTTAELARCGGTQLQEVLANRFSGVIEHVCESLSQKQRRIICPDV